MLLVFDTKFKVLQNALISSAVVVQDPLQSLPASAENGEIAKNGEAELPKQIAANDEAHK